MRVPDHWDTNSWEEKAQEHPFFAIMTNPAMSDATPENFTDEHRAAFFAKGRLIFDSHVRPLVDRMGISLRDHFLVDYGCGAGRIMRAVVDQGLPCAGIDISPTMLGWCRRFVPEARELHALDADGRCAMAADVASVVYSFAVVQHIATLSMYLQAFSEMARVLRSGGWLAVQVNSFDFELGTREQPGRTENFEDHSVHYRPGSPSPDRTHRNTTWSGVHIGIDLLRQHLASRHVTLLDVYTHSPAKPKGVWVIGEKQ